VKHRFLLDIMVLFFAVKGENAKRCGFRGKVVTIPKLIRSAFRN